jgi:hypothetical protein
VVTSAATAVTSTPCAARIASAVACSASAPRAFITRCTPAAASASAQPRPSPFDEAQTIARFPLIPRSMPGAGEERAGRQGVSATMVTVAPTCCAPIVTVSPGAEDATRPWIGVPFSFPKASPSSVTRFPAPFSDPS